MLGLLRNNFNKFNKFNKNFSYYDCNCKYEKPTFGPGFFSFLWGGIFMLLITTKMRNQNYYLYMAIEDLKKDVNNIKKDKK